MTVNMKYDKHLTIVQKVGQLVTGVCCQWRGSASYDRDVHIETFVLRGNFSGEIATEQQPPSR
jgi:hypothetical protein